MGGFNVSFQLKFRPFVSCQLHFVSFVSCQLDDCYLRSTRGDLLCLLGCVTC